MVVRSFAAAPPTPWSKDLAEPKIHETAYIHSFSNIIGDARIDARVMIAPGTSIRADEGKPFYIGEGSSILDGVVIHGLEQGRVVGDDQKQYSVWIGKNTSISQMALIHGPAYIGDDCFIGFRSTVFNARVGQGCIVMMHALIQDVEIPARKYVPSGAVITNQQQADRLRDVEVEDMEFAKALVGINDALRAGYQCAENEECITPIRNHVATSSSTSSYGSNGANGSRGSNISMTSTSLSSETVEQVRQLLAQGYKIGSEHVDQRRFRTGSWQSCSPIATTNVSEALGALEDCLANHQGEYVRLFGIDPKAKRRVLETIIQRPDDKVSQQAKATSGSSGSKATATSSASNFSTSASSAQLNSETVDHVRQLVAQGYKIGTEHVDQRRFRTGSWQSCSPITTTNVSEALGAVQDCLANHQGEYVRLFGIDPKAKRRVLETIIQRPDDKVSQQAKATSGSSGSKATATSSASNFSTSASSAQLNSETVDQVRQLVGQGYKIGTEHVDQRRFRTGSWQSCSPITTTNVSEALGAVQDCLANHQGEYVRLFGIDPKAKRRVLETIIQRPDGKVAQPATEPRGDNGNNQVQSTPASNSRNKMRESTSLKPEVVDQLRQLLAQGYRISAEHVDERRFRTGSWQSCGQIETTQESEAIAALESHLAEYKGEYVRLIGIEPKAKRRVLETIIQRPNEPALSR